MAVESEASDDQAIEVAGEEVGEIEGPRLLVGELAPAMAALVAYAAQATSAPTSAIRGVR